MVTVLSHAAIDFNGLTIPFYFLKALGYFSGMILGKNKHLLVAACGALALNFVTGCAGRTQASKVPTDPTSLSEIAVGVAGGAIQGTGISGTQAYYKKIVPKTMFAKLFDMFNLQNIADAYVPTTGYCPNIQNTTGLATPPSTCVVNGTQIAFGLADCGYPNSAGTWGGTQYIIISSSPSNTVLACNASYPFVANDVFTRSFGPATTRAAIGGLDVLVDTSGIQSGWQTPIAVTGEKITVGAGSNTIVINGMHVAASSGNYVVWDHTVQTAGGSPIVVNPNTGLIASGTIVVQSNQNTSVATVNLAGLAIPPGCCWPTSGSVVSSIVKTVGANTAAPTTTSTTETLAFQAPCGQATLNGSSFLLQQCF